MAASSICRRLQSYALGLAVLAFGAAAFPAWGSPESSADSQDAQPKVGHVDVTADQHSDANSLLRQGIQKEAEGDPGQAERLFHQALSIDHYNANAYFNLGALAEKRGAIAEALRNYRLALAIKPEDVEFQQAVGSLEHVLQSQRPQAQVPVAQRGFVQEHVPNSAPALNYNRTPPPELTVKDGRSKKRAVLGAAARAAFGAAITIGLSSAMRGTGLHCPMCQILNGRF